jgi:hypothetical protein
MFCVPGPIFGGTDIIGSNFHILAPGPVFGGTDSVGSRFHVLRSRTNFWRYRRRQVLFSCFALRDSFSGGPRASGPFFMFCAPEPIFSGTKGVRSSFHVSRSRTRFQQYRRRRDPFSCFALPDPFSALPRASGHVFMFCVPGPVFDGTVGVRSRFHVLRSHNHFHVLRSWTHF